MHVRCGLGVHPLPPTPVAEGYRIADSGSNVVALVCGPRSRISSSDAPLAGAAGMSRVRRASRTLSEAISAGRGDDSRASVESTRCSSRRNSGPCDPWHRAERVSTHGRSRFMGRCLERTRLVTDTTWRFSGFCIIRGVARCGWMPRGGNPSRFGRPMTLFFGGGKGSPGRLRLERCLTSELVGLIPPGVCTSDFFFFTCGVVSCVAHLSGTSRLERLVVHRCADASRCSEYKGFISARRRGSRAASWRAQPGALSAPRVLGRWALPRSDSCDACDGSACDGRPH